MNLIKGKNRLKKENEGGEKTNSSKEEFVIVEKKGVQKTDSSNNYFEENKLATSKDDFEKNKSAHGNRNEPIEEVMKQKRIKLRSLIIKVLSDEERNKINEINTNIEAKPVKIYRQFGNKKVCWGSMRKLLNRDTKDQSKLWIDDEVINFYFKIFFAEMDQKQCQAEPGQNRSGFLGSFFWQQLTNEKHNDMTVRGKYNYKNVSRWLKKLPGGDIFYLKKIFFLINEKNKHLTCIVIFMKEKRIQYYD
jgi:hypothetical protein